LRGERRVNSGNLVARNDLNAVSPLGAATVLTSNASDGVAIAPASGTTSGNALKLMAPGSSATIQTTERRPAARRTSSTATAT